MFSASSILAATALLAGIGHAAPTARAGTLPVFNLTATSAQGKAYYDASLIAEHSGAGQEALAVNPGPPSPFSFNQSINAGDAVPGYTSPGYIQYTTPYQGPTPQQQLKFFVNQSSNINAASFGAATSGPVLFAINTSNGRLAYYESGAFVGQSPSVNENFYICPITWTGDQFYELSYVVEGQTPDNADCDAVYVYTSDYN